MPPPLSPGVPAATTLAGVAGRRPEVVVPAEELGRPFGKDGAWVSSRTGIQQLRRLSEESDLVEHAAAAARDAIAQAGLAPDELDLVIVATCSANRRPTDRLGDRILHRLGIARPEMTINAACSGFCYALSTADALIRAGNARHVLVVAAESMSALIDPTDLGTSIIFGDGAGAAVVSAAVDGRPGIGPAVFGSDGAHADLIAAVPGTPNPYLGMQGREVFRWAVDTVPQIAEAACARAGVALSDVDAFVPHQANLRIIDAVARRLGLGRHVAVADDIVESGNTSAASIPLALARLRNGHVPPGALALLVGFGAGLAYAAQVVRLP